MRKRTWLLGIIIFMLLLWGAYNKLRQTSSIRQLQQELQQLRQAGEPTTIEEFVPPVPPNRDGTVLYKLAITQLDMAQKQIPCSTWDSIYEFISRKPNKPFNPADVQKTLHASQPALQTLRRALNYQHMRMTDWNVENLMATMFPHFLRFREFARLLAAEGKWHKQKGDIDGAIESHMMILKLVRRMGDEPSLILGFLVQGTIFATAFNGLQQVLTDSEPSLQTYRALMAELQSWDIDRDFVRALQSERAFVIAVCDWMREKASRREIHDILISNHQRIELTVWLSGKSLLIAQNELKMLQHFKAFIPIARKGVPYDWKEVKRIENQWSKEVDRPAKEFMLGGVRVSWDENFIAKMFASTFSPVFKKAATFHALQRLAQVALALRLYRHEHGRYPEMLSELLPKYLPNVPVDPFDGKPLRYKRLQRGFKIWSVGWNMKDEGGIEGKPRWVEGDIIWEAVK